MKAIRSVCVEVSDFERSLAFYRLLAVAIFERITLPPGRPRRETR